MTTTLPTLAFRANPRAFANTVGWVARYVPARPVTPVIGGMLLEVADGILTVSAFDYDTAAQARVDVDAAATGRALVSGRLLAEMAKTFPDKPVDVALAGSALTVRCGGVKLTLPMMGVADYPTLPGMPPAVGTVDGIDLAALAARVGPAADLNGKTGRKVLHGVHVDLGPSEIEMLGSDSYQVAQGRIPWQAATDATIAVTVAAPALIDAGRALDAPGPVSIGYDPSAGVVGLATDDRTIVTRLLAGEYPTGVRATIPQRADRPATVATAALTLALKRADIVRQESPVALAFAPGELTISGKGDAETGEAIECGYDGEPITLHINPQRLTDALAGLRSDTAEISLTHPHRPVVLTSPDDAGRTYRYAVMPIRAH